MKSFKLSEFVRIVNGTILQGTDDILIKNVTYILKAKLRRNTLFFLRKRFQLQPDLIKRSKLSAIVTDMPLDEFRGIDDCTIIYVKDIENAYWSFVEYYRSLFNIPVVAVTGTSGKTTTIYMISHILRQTHNIQNTRNSANGRTGHIAKLLAIDESTEAAVFETAVGRPGDITYACRYFKPTIGIITNIGTAHLDLCETQEGYIRAKAEIVSAVGDNGVLILNADDKNTQKIGLGKFAGRIVWFGIHNPSDFKASDIKYVENGVEFTLELNHIEYPIFVPASGEHQVYNALAALAAVYGLGVDIEKASERLKTFEGLVHHLELMNGICGCQILDDTWSLTPVSLASAFKTLNTISNGRKRAALVGRIDRLGDYVAEFTEQIADMIIESGVDILLAIGPTGEIIYKRILQKDAKIEVYTFSDTEEVYDVLQGILDEDTILLVKCHMHDHKFKALFERLKG